MRGLQNLQRRGPITASSLLCPHCRWIYNGHANFDRKSRDTSLILHTYNADQSMSHISAFQKLKKYILEWFVYGNK